MLFLKTFKNFFKNAYYEIEHYFSKFSSPIDNACFIYYSRGSIARGPKGGIEIFKVKNFLHTVKGSKYPILGEGVYSALASSAGCKLHIIGIGTAIDN